MDSEEYYSVRLVKKTKAKEALFYMTSFGLPWWVYITSILRLRLKGYELVVYDFDRIVIDNDNPQVLLNTVSSVVKDMHKRRTEYENNDVLVVGGVGNSLGAYMLYNYCLNFPLNNIVLNGGGSISDMIFQPINSQFKKINEKYVSKGFSNKSVDKLWAEIDDIKLAENVRANNVLIYRSIHDDTIPPSSTKRFIDAFNKSEADLTVIEDKKTHVGSVMSNSFKIKQIYRFLSKGKVS